MGVPSFFSWLSQKFPNISIKAIEISGDNSLPNPNSIEFDNLYLDMNGIVHPCIHPDGKSQPKSEEHMFESIFKYLDRVFHIVRPRKVIYFAFDGVAPRAKQNQQRARRFQSIKEKEKVKLIEDQFRDEWENKNTLPVQHTPFDSNVISPGTEFMGRLMKAIDYYIRMRCQFDLGWMDLKVIFSGCDQPGEGEHKIIDYIKSQRAQKEYYPNTKHVLVGLDADLIFLSLVTHEPYFYILREQMFRSKGRTSFEFLNCGILRDYLRKEFKELPSWERSIDDFIFLCILVGNDFLPRLPSLEIQEGAIDALISTYKFSFEKMGGYICDAGVIDHKRLEMFLARIGEMEKFVFSVRIKKNDYLRLQREKSVNGEKMKKEKLLKIEEIDETTPKDDVTPLSPKDVLSPTIEKTFKEDLSIYVGNISFDATEQSIYEHFIVCGQIEDLHLPVFDGKLKGFAFISFQNVEARDAALALHGKPFLGRELKISLKKPNLPKKNKEFKEIFVGNFALTTTKKDLVDIFSAFGDIKSISLPEHEPHKGFTFIEFTNVESYKKCLAVEEIKLGGYVLRVTPANQKYAERGDPVDYKYQKGLKKKIKTTLGIRMEDHPDVIRLGDENDENWKDRYYDTNFVKTEVSEVVKAYIEGISWVTSYYFNKCPSWNWYYRFHYAPFASDMKNIDFKVEFLESKPFKPFQQLLAILPPGSKHALPTPYHKLMEKGSEIIDFYPSEWKVDLVGVKMEYRGVVLLPFIDEGRLLKAMDGIDEELTEGEKIRNSTGFTHIYFNDGSSLCRILKDNQWVTIDPTLSGGLFGSLKVVSNNLYGTYPTPFKELTKFGDIKKDLVYHCHYTLPEYSHHICELLPGIHIVEDLTPSSPFIFAFDFEGMASPKSAHLKRLEHSDILTLEIPNHSKPVAIREDQSLEYRVEKLEQLLVEEREKRIALEQQVAQLESLVLQKLQ